MANNNRLGELLVREKLISLTQLRHAQDEQQKSGQQPRLHAREARLRQRRRDHELPQPAVPRPDDQPRGVRDRRRRPEARARRSRASSTRCIPVSRTGNSLIVAMADPTNINAIDDLKFLTGYNIEPVIASETAIHDGDREVLQRRPLVRRGDGRLRRDGDRVHRRRRRASTSSSSRRPSEDAPVVQLVQHDAAQRHQEGRERHPHRAVREEASASATASTACSPRR